MSSKWYCNLAERLRLRGTNFRGAVRFLMVILFAMVCLVWRARAAGDAPGWMHALVNAPLPAHDEKTDAVLLYSEKTVTVVSADKIKTTVRVAYKILRPAGHDYGVVVVSYNAHEKITAIKGWCIPAQGKD
jgi:hypothetical protein